jgi:NAD(P)-dependent dehydrogenase (short-subunit alcohol dehydrogenase family)
MGGDFGLLGDAGNVLGGAVAGFLKGLKQELPSVVFKVVDFDARTPTAQVAANALAELEEGSDRLEVAYLADRRYVTNLRRAPFPEGDAPGRPIDPRWVLLFSGGGRGAVFEVAKAMARLGPRVVLTGRTPLPRDGAPHLELDDAAFEAYRQSELLRMRRADPTLTPVKFTAAFEAVARERELHQNLSEAARLSLPVEYQVCDIRDLAQVEKLAARVRLAHGRIDGVVHGAMVETSKSLPDKTPEVVASTMAVKVQGLANLLEATRADDLQVMLCFGSGAGRFGNKGQSDYCAANDLMAKCAMAYAHRARGDVRCATIDWTAWENIGAAARDREKVAATGVSFISPAEGVYWFLNELRLGGTEREVAIFDEKLFREWPFLGKQADGPSPTRVWDDRGALLVASDTPLIDAVLEQSEGHVLLARRLDLSRDRFLSQHQLHGVPILPGTFGFEMMAEAASLVRPDLDVLRGIDLQIDVPLKLFRGQSVNVRVLAKVVKEEGETVTVSVETSSELRLGGSELRQHRTHHRGLFVLGRMPAAEPGTGSLPAALPGARGRSIFHLAREPVFLGPLFCRAEWVFVGEETVEGIIRAPRQREIFSHMTKPWFQLDPLLLDAAFQVAANWDGHHHGLVSVPMGVAALVRGRPRRLPESAHVKARALGATGKDALYDIEVRGDDGALLLQVERLWLRRLEPTRRGGGDT